MNLFCLLCIPLLYFIRRIPDKKKSIWALPLGGLAVMLHYFTGPLITADGFGFFRWMSGFIDIVALPVLIPFLAALLLVILRVFPAGLDYAGFTLLWLVPLAAIRLMSGDSPPSPLPLILVPLLWIAQAVGIPFLIARILKKPHWHIILLLALGIATLPLIATTSWWAFFVQQNLPGFLLLAVSLVPAAISLMLDLRESRDQGLGNKDQDYCSSYQNTSEQSKINPEVPTYLEQQSLFSDP
jgi:hypothetical protein